DDTDKPKSDLKQELEEIGKSLRALTDSFNALNRAVGNIGDDLRATKKDVERLKDEIDRLRESRRKLEDRLAKLEGNSGQKSFYEGPGGGTGSIAIENQNATYTATVVVNGTTYTLPPGQGKRLDGMTAGPLTYSITATNGLGQTYVIQPMKTSVLQA